MDLSKIPVVPFQMILFSLVFLLLGIVYFLLPDLFEGAVWSVIIQIHFFQGKFLFFRLYKDRSMTLQLLIMTLSFFANAAFLVIFGIPKGSNFILGFFLAYFMFLGIFVISAILSVRVVRGNI
jgi:hypothetical protein